MLSSTFQIMQTMCVATVETDVAVLAIYYESRIQCNLFVEIGSKVKKRIISVSKMAVNVGQDMADALPALHAISGCDSTSAFYGVGKKKVYNILKNVGAYIQALKELGNQHIFNKLFSSYSEDGCRVLWHLQLHWYK